MLNAFGSRNGFEPQHLQHGIRALDAKAEEKQFFRVAERLWCLAPNWTRETNDEKGPLGQGFTKVRGTPANGASYQTAGNVAPLIEGDHYVHTNGVHEK